MNGKNAPLVSVIMPAYNAQATIQESIDSVIAQSFPEWELIIINDCSKDETWDLIQKATEKDSRIHPLANERNIGVAATRNRAIQEAKGEYVAFLDSDDLWHADKLKKHLAFIKENDASISYTATAYLRNGVRSDYVLRAVKKFTRRDLLKRNIMSCSSMIVKRDLMLRHLFPICKEKIHEDYVAWLNALEEVGIAYGLDKPLLIYRLSDNTKSSGRITSAIMIFNAYRSAGYNIISSCFLALRYAKHSISKRYMIKTGS